MNETSNQQKIIDYFRGKKYLAYKIEFKRRAGCPDLLIVRADKGLRLVEIKTHSMMLEPLQQKTMQELTAEGVVCLALHITVMRYFIDCKFTLFDLETFAPIKHCYGYLLEDLLFP